MRKTAKKNRKLRWPFLCLLLLAIQIAVIFALPALAAEATPPGPTPPPSPAPTPAASPTLDPSMLPNETPTVDFDDMDMPSADDFFNTDGRTDVADHDNPAYIGEETPPPEDLPSYIGDLLRDNAETVDIVIFLTLLSLIPTLLITLSGFTRIIIVLSFTRNALGTQNMPPNQVMIGLALFLTLFLMFPLLEQMNEEALEPYLRQEIDIQEAGDRAIAPLRDFMLRQTNKEDLDLFIDLANLTPEDVVTDEQGVREVPMHVVIPAFLVSEIKTGFLIGFFIYIPFLVIDMIVASTLMSMGMMMLPPVMISLPFKILLFVSANGWGLLITTLLGTFK